MRGHPEPLFAVARPKRKGGSDPDDNDLFTAYEAVNEHSMLSRVPNHLQDEFILPDKVGKATLKDARKAEHRTLARSLGPETPKNFPSFAEPVRFPRSTWMSSTPSKEGLATLAPLEKRAPDADLDHLFREIDKTEILRKEAGLTSWRPTWKSITRTVRPNSRRSGIDRAGHVAGEFPHGLGLAEFSAGQKRNAGIRAEDDPDFGELQSMAERLGKSLKEKNELKDALKEKAAEHLSAEDFSKEIDRLKDFSFRLEKAAELLNQQNCILREPVVLEDLTTKFRLLLKSKDCLPDLCAFNDALRTLDSTYRCDAFIRSALTLDGRLEEVFAKRFLRELCRACREGRTSSNFAVTRSSEPARNLIRLKPSFAIRTAG